MINAQPAATSAPVHVVANNGHDVKPEKPRHGLKVLSIGELLSLELPPREYLLSPLIPMRGLAMLYAPRGIGKTYLALSISYAIAAGDKALRWQAPASRRVLYVDGEMPLESLQQRLAAVVGSAEKQADPENFKLLAADHQDFGLPDLATIDGQAKMEPYLDGIQLLVLDNLSTLVRSGKENEAECWTLIQEWLLDLRRRGIAVLFVHHAGKDGNQRGTSKKEDVLDTVICLRRPANYEPKQGARFEIHLEKARGVFGEAADPFEASLTIEDTPDLKRATWACKDLEDVKMIQVVDLLREGLSLRDVAAETGIPKSTVKRMKDRAAAEGLIDA